MISYKHFLNSSSATTTATPARPSNPNTTTQPRNLGSTDDRTYPDVGGPDLNPLGGVGSGGLRLPG